MGGKEAEGRGGPGRYTSLRVLSLYLPWIIRTFSRPIRMNNWFCSSLPAHPVASGPLRMTITRRKIQIFGWNIQYVLDGKGERRRESVWEYHLVYCSSKTFGRIGKSSPAPSMNFWDKFQRFVPSKLPNKETFFEFVVFQTAVRVLFYVSKRKLPLRWSSRLRIDTSMKRTAEPVVVRCFNRVQIAWNFLKEF